jgi:hypothetical protein
VIAVGSRQGILDVFDDPRHPCFVVGDHQCESALYRSQFLRIRATAPIRGNPFAEGVYYDIDDRPVGSYVVTSPPGKRWNGEPTVAVTDIFDTDQVLFMRILHRRWSLWSARRTRGQRRDCYVMVDGDDTEIGVFTPRVPVYFPLRVDVTITSFGRGHLAFVRDDPGQRVFRLRADQGVLLATIFVPRGALVWPGEEISIEHESEAPAAWRCTTLALATCLPQFGVGSAVNARLPF